jgi:flagellar biosynthesis protein FlhF
MLVGPTGVGKTTTIAKIAAHLTVLDTSQRKRAHIITIDKVRIAAIEQIEAYGKYMDIAVTVATSNSDLRNQIDKYASSVDYIFIDTVGASPSDTKLLLNMKDIVYLRENNNFITYLTLSASTKNRDMKDIMKSYALFDYDSLIITKLDETKSVGNIISVLSDTQKTLSYITTGQSVPRNIEIASVAKLVSLLEDEKQGTM